MSDIVYLDVCCFKRPFDDQSQPRIRREAEAIAAILDAAATGAVRLVRSAAHDFEIDWNPRDDRRAATRLWLETAVLRTSGNRETAARARQLATLTFSPLDALHLAFSEQSRARWFVTTDDRLLSPAHANRERLRVEVIRPDQYSLISAAENA